jgi:hypothetical protein
MPPLAGQRTRAGSMILAVNTLTEFYAQNRGMPSRFDCVASDGNKPVV